MPLRRRPRSRRAGSTGFPGSDQSMLHSLSIRDVVLIDRLDIAFAPGLTVLTGETGAGKSILLDSLGLALGARAEGGMLRPGAHSFRWPRNSPSPGPSGLGHPRRPGHRGGSIADPAPGGRRRRPLARLRQRRARQCRPVAPPGRDLDRNSRPVRKPHAARPRLHRRCSIRLPA